MLLEVISEGLWERLIERRGELVIREVGVGVWLKVRLG